MGWKKQWDTNRIGKEKPNDGIKVGSWNKGGALQPLFEKINDIEQLMKTNNFAILGISEANLFKENDIQDVQISGYSLYYDKGQNCPIRRNSRCVLFIRNDLKCKLREDLMEENIPEIWVEVLIPN